MGEGNVIEEEGGEVFGNLERDRGDRGIEVVKDKGKGSPLLGRDEGGRAFQFLLVLEGEGYFEGDFFCPSRFGSGRVRGLFDLEGDFGGVGAGGEGKREGERGRRRNRVGLVVGFVGDRGLGREGRFFLVGGSGVGLRGRGGGFPVDFLFVEKDIERDKVARDGFEVADRARVFVD